MGNAGSDLVRVVPDTGGDNEYDIYQTFLAAISHARRRIWITQAYFLPDRQLLDALKNAARRRVDVRILLPGFSDSWMALSASHARYGELLEAGIRLYERTDAMLHAKTAVVDGVWSTVGSSNFDYRSFLHNDEANAVIVGRDFDRKMEDLFRRDLKHGEEITLDQWL